MQLKVGALHKSYQHTAETAVWTQAMKDFAMFTPPVTKNEGLSNGVLDILSDDS